jgi:hypothetical protein
MAISLLDEYPLQVAPGDPGYPLGRPQNVTTPGDGTGFPLEEKWAQDLHGFLQSLLAEVEANPSGTPDQVGD